VLLFLATACSNEFATPDEVGVAPWEDQDAEPPPDPRSETWPPGAAFLVPTEAQLYDPYEALWVELVTGDHDAASLAALSLSWGGVAADLGAPRHPGTNGLVRFDLPVLDLGDYEITVVVTDDDALSTTTSVHFSVVLRDADADGYENAGLGGTDCNDNDPAISPAAEEVCDEVDNDCDGQSDEGVTTRYYADIDGDGFGDAAAPLDACAQPEGYVLGANDCDDTDPTVFGGNPETCDDLDNDCNGLVDDGVLVTYYADADGDGWGDPGATALDCSPPEGYLAVAGDCLDSDASVSPDATEICMDGIDNDCDGTSNDCALRGLVELSDASAKLQGEASSHFAGLSVAAAGDVDGDGLADLLIGAYGNDDGGTDAGAAYLVLGPASDGALSAAEAQLTGEDAGDYAGWSVAGVGDWDGDGLADLAIGAYGADDAASGAGLVYVVTGGPAGDLDLGASTFMAYGESYNDAAGWSVAGAGDYTGDGTPDLVVGAYGDDDGGSGAGSAYVVAGGRSGGESLSLAYAHLVGVSSDDAAGYSVAGAGDTNGDGIDDVLVGAYLDGTGGAGAGAAFLVFGPASGEIDLGSADVSFLGETAGDDAGAAVAGAGDTDGDGNDDLLVGAYGHDYGGSNAGAAYLLLGGARLGITDLSAADAKLVGESADDNAGYSLASAGDMDGDGRSDILVGAFREDTRATSAGAVYLCYGPVSSVYDLGTAEGKLVGEAADDYAGYAVAGAGDTDGDGKADILVGAPYEDAGGPSRAGSAYVVLGTGL
jgi:hypothetical protein